MKNRFIELITQGFEYGYKEGKQMNMYDFMEFPNYEVRQKLRTQYTAFEQLKQISYDPSTKYDNKEVPFEFVNFQMTGKTRINEYNYSIFIMNIPLFQMLHIYTTMTSCIDKLKDQYYSFLFNYYSELLAYYIDCAFKKSVNIFNEIFELKINDGHNSFAKIIKELKKKSEQNVLIKKVSMKLLEISENIYYKQIIDMRNRNTHSVRATQFGFIDIFDSSKGVTTTVSSMPLKPDFIVKTTQETICILGKYTEFIEKTIEEYYDYLFQSYKRFKETNDMDSLMSE